MVYTEALQHAEARTSTVDSGGAWQGGYAKRLTGTIEEQEVDLCEYSDYCDAYQQIRPFLDDAYAHKPILSSMRYLTPAEFGVRWREEHSLVLDLELRTA